MYRQKRLELSENKTNNLSYKELAFKRMTNLVYGKTNIKKVYCPNCKQYLSKTMIREKSKFIPIGFYCLKCEVLYIKT